MFKLRKSGVVRWARANPLLRRHLKPAVAAARSLLGRPWTAVQPGGVRPEVVRARMPPRERLRLADYALRQDPARAQHFAIHHPHYPLPAGTAAFRAQAAPLRIPGTGRHLLILHAFYPEETRAILAIVRREYAQFDVAVTTSSEAIADLVDEQLAGMHFVCLRVPNVGRDILPFLLLAQFLDVSKYSHFIKLHTKRSAHLPGGRGWLAQELAVLLPGAGASERTLRSIPSGSTTIAGTVTLALQDHFYQNRHWVRHLGGVPRRRLKGRFIPGAMFIGGVGFLQMLRDKNLLVYPMEPEAGQLDGCMPHALERMFGFWSRSHGGRVRRLGRRFARVPRANY